MADYIRIWRIYRHLSTCLQESGKEKNPKRTERKTTERHEHLKGIVLTVECPSKYTPW